MLVHVETRDSGGYLAAAATIPMGSLLDLVNLPLPNVVTGSATGAPGDAQYVMRVDTTGLPSGSKYFLKMTTTIGKNDVAKYVTLQIP